MTVPGPRLVWRQLGWAALIWVTSVSALGAVSLVIRFWLHA
jgi:hypothetical protein